MLNTILIEKNNCDKKFSIYLGVDFLSQFTKVAITNNNIYRHTYSQQISSL